MLKPAIFSGKTVLVDEKVREEVDSYLIHVAGPYGEMALSVAFDIALVQNEQTLMQARVNDKNVEIAIKMRPPVSPLKATASTKGASWAMFDTLRRKGVLTLRKGPDATYLMVKVRRVDNAYTLETNYQPIAAVACA